MDNFVESSITLCSVTPKDNAYLGIHNGIYVTYSRLAVHSAKWNLEKKTYRSQKDECRGDLERGRQAVPPSSDNKLCCNRDGGIFGQKVLGLKVAPELFWNVMAEPCQVLRELTGIPGACTKRRNRRMCHDKLQSCCG